MQPTFTLTEGLLVLTEGRSKELELIDKQLYFRAMAFRNLETGYHSEEVAREAWKLMDETERGKYREKFNAYAINKKNEFVKEGGRGLYSIRLMQETYKILGAPSSSFYQEVLESAIADGGLHAVEELIKENCIDNLSKNEIVTLICNWLRVYPGSGSNQLEVRGKVSEILSFVGDYPDNQLATARRIGENNSNFEDIAEALPEPNKTKFLCSYIFVNERKMGCSQLQQRARDAQNKLSLPHEIKAKVSLLVVLGRVEEADKIIDEHFGVPEKEMPPRGDPETLKLETKPKKPMSLRELIESDSVLKR